MSIEAISIMPGYHNETPGFVGEAFKPKMLEIMDLLKDPEEADSFTKLNSKVDKAEVQVRENVSVALLRFQDLKVRPNIKIG